MSPVDTTHYTYRVSWSAEDEEFVGTCVEFASLSWLAGSREEALRGIGDLVDEVVSDMDNSGEEVPEPLATRPYSGKFQLRQSPQLHRHLALEAAEHHASLNQYVVSKLQSRSPR